MSRLPDDIAIAIDALTAAHENEAVSGLPIGRTEEIDAAYEALAETILAHLGCAALSDNRSQTKGE